MPLRCEPPSAFSPTGAWTPPRPGKGRGTWWGVIFIRISAGFGYSHPHPPPLQLLTGDPAPHLCSAGEPRRSPAHSPSEGSAGVGAGLSAGATAGLCGGEAGGDLAGGAWLSSAAASFSPASGETFWPRGPPCAGPEGVWGSGLPPYPSYPAAPAFSSPPPACTPPAPGR